MTSRATVSPLTGAHADLVWTSAGALKHELALPSLLNGAFLWREIVPVLRGSLNKLLCFIEQEIVLRHCKTWLILKKTV